MKGRAGRAVVVIVTYESAAVVPACLEAVQQGGEAPEIVVVDNGSSDGSADRAASFPGVRVIRNPENRGFAAAANQGVAAGEGDPVVLLNPDTRVRPGWLAALVAALEDPSVGIAGCKILETDGETLQHVGGVVRANALTEHVGRGEVDRGQHDDRRDVEYVTGAALALGRPTWEMLGGLHEGYFPAYFEDLELCWRARELGLRVVVVPEARVLHVEAASSTSAAYRRAYHRNRLRFVIRNYPVRHLLGRFVRGELRWLLGARPGEQLPALLGAYARAALELPRALVQRGRSRSEGQLR